MKTAMQKCLFSQVCHVTDFTGQSDTRKTQQHTLMSAAAQKQISI